MFVEVFCFINIFKKSMTVHILEIICYTIQRVREKVLKKTLKIHRVSRERLSIMPHAAYTNGVR